jgi:hypothetical protein
MKKKNSRSRVVTEGRTVEVKTRKRGGGEFFFCSV